MDLIEYDRNKLKSVCDKYGIDLVILHGSRAKGFATDKSDIDIGIIGNASSIGSNYFNIISGFSDIFGDKTDIAFLNGAEPMICFNTAMAGIPLFERTKGLFTYYKVKTINRYNDAKKFRDLEKRYIKAAIKGGIEHHDQR